MKKERNQDTLRRIIAVILFASLALSVVYSFLGYLNAPDSVPDGMPHEKVKSDYLLMLTQCALGAVVMLLPSIINKRWSIPIPRMIYILYYVFLYCAIFLGEVLSFYYLIPHWDLILHFFSGAMLSAVGFILVDLLNQSAHSVSLSPLFESIFAFCFALALGAIWEIYEFAGDAILGLNMQKALLADGTELVGKAALADTMEDLIVDAFAALVIAIIGYKSNKKQLKAAQEGGNHEVHS